MDAVTIESLYEDANYINHLVKLSGKNLLPFDDYRQEVFMYLAEFGGDPTKAAKRIAMRMRRRKQRERSYAISDRDFAQDNDGILWEELHTIA